MKGSSRYRQGQRWTFKSSVAEFENTLVIGRVIEALPEWEATRQYEVYVQYSDVAKPSIASDYDGVVFSLTDKALDRNVTKLVASGVKLPWWWVYGRRLKSKKDAPSGCGMICCDRVSEALPSAFQSAKQIADDSRAREQALREHRKKFGSKRRRPKPSKTVAESWQRIESWYAENAQPTGSSLAPGASAAAIKRFEKSIGARLPDDFKESVRIHDGGGWCVPWRYGELLSLEGILRQWNMYSEWQAKGDYAMSGENSQTQAIKGPIKPIFWNKLRIHVTDNSGDHLTLDLDPPATGKYGQVLDHSHEVGPTEVLASGWGVFLRNLLRDLESGKYVYLKGSLELVEDLERGLIR